MLHNHHKMMTTTITRECKLAANRLTEFPLELTNLPNLNLLDLSLNQVDGLILTLVLLPIIYW